MELQKEKGKNKISFVHISYQRKSRKDDVGKTLLILLFQLDFIPNLLVFCLNWSGFFVVKEIATRIPPTSPGLKPNIVTGRCLFCVGPFYCHVFLQEMPTLRGKQSCLWRTKITRPMSHGFVMFELGWLHCPEKWSISVKDVFAAPEYWLIKYGQSGRLNLHAYLNVCDAKKWGFRLRCVVWIDRYYRLFFAKLHGRSCE